MIKLSIIIPHYNSVSLLRKLLESIPIIDEIQTIVIDDMSTEGLYYLEELKNDPLYKDVLFLTNNTGIQSAGKCRNIGLDNAQGEWLLFADSDDFFINDFYLYIKEYFNKEVDLIYFKPTSIYKDTGKLSNRHIRHEKLITNYLKDNSFESEIKLRYQFPEPWSKLIKRQLIVENNIRFDEVIAMNDIMFSTKVGFYSKNIIVTNKVIYCVTRNKGSLTMNMSEEVYDSRINAYIRYSNFLKNNLRKNEIKYLHFNSIGPLLRAYQGGLGLRKTVKTYRKLKKNNINLFDKRLLNPFFTIRKIRQISKNHLEQKKYYNNN